MCYVSPTNFYGCRTLSNDPSLYGGEELDFQNRVQKRGKYGAYIREIEAHHLGNECRDSDYVLWKYLYGYMGIISDDFSTFKNDRIRVIAGYKMWVDNEENEALVKLARKRLKQIYDD